MLCGCVANCTHSTTHKCQRKVSGARTDVPLQRRLDTTDSSAPQATCRRQHQKHWRSQLPPLQCFDTLLEHQGSANPSGESRKRGVQRRQCAVGRQAKRGRGNNVNRKRKVYYNLPPPPPLHPLFLSSSTRTCMHARACSQNTETQKHRCTSYRQWSTHLSDRVNSSNGVVHPFAQLSLDRKLYLTYTITLALIEHL